MIALTIDDVRPFMAALLTGDVFDHFLMREGSVTTFCTYTIDGLYQRSFDEDSLDGETAGESSPAADYVPWSRLRPLVFSLIKGRRTPLALRFVFQLTPGDTAAFLTKASLSGEIGSVLGLCLNVRYDNNRVTLTTGTAQRHFPPNRLVDQAWDDAIRRFCKARGIPAEVML